MQRILFDGQRAIGVDYRRGKDTAVAYAAGEILLAAGSVNSPKLLLSGIGPADHLRSAGIEPLLDLPGVGGNLQDHLRIPVLYRSDRPSPGRMANWIPAGADYLLRRRGVLASNCCESGAYVRSSGDIEERTFNSLPTSSSDSILEPWISRSAWCAPRVAERSGFGRQTLPTPRPSTRTTCRTMRISSRGSRGPPGSPARAVQRAPPLSPARGDSPRHDLVSDQELAAYCRATADTCYHPVGTCAFGCGPLAVTDQDLRVHGTRGLRAVDASIMPELVAGNTLAAVVMIAEKTAAAIAAG